MTPDNSCVQCGKCLEVCPLFKATGREELTPRAKFFLQTLDPSKGLSRSDFNSLASLCLSCGRCAENCPQNMSGKELVSDLRADSGSFVRGCWDLWLSRPGLLWPMAAALSRFSPEALPEPFGSAKKKMEVLFAKSPEPWAKLIPGIRPGERKAVLFKGCTARYARKDWGLKAEKILDAMGIVRLQDPDFACCGSPYGSAGLVSKQKASRKRNIQIWQEIGEPLLVTFCSTCLKGLRAYGPVDFNGDGQLLQRWQESLTPLSFLLQGADVSLMENSPAQVVYHKPCHAGADDPDLRLVEKIAGERLAPVQDDLCCGFGGVMQLGAPELSCEVGGYCVERLTMELEPGAQIVTGCSACVIQLATIAKDAYFASHWLDNLK